MKFFRKVRQNMVRGNKVTKYILYAIGEIALVVIGILIALQINNSNSLKKERQLEQEYLLSLKTEFETNLVRVNESIKANEIRSASLDKLLSLFDRDIRDTTSIQSMSESFRPILGGTLSYDPSIGVMRDLISSGRLNIIQNKSLRQNLASFESSLDFLRIQIDELSKRRETILMFIFKNGSIRNVAKNAGFEFANRSISEKVDNKQLFELSEFENNMIDYNLTTKSTGGQWFLSGIKTEIETILKEIEQELDQNSIQEND